MNMMHGHIAIEPPTNVPVWDVDPYAPEILSAPEEYYAGLRSRGSFVFIPKYSILACGRYEETKEVTDALSLPVAGGEQEYSLHGFRWLIANNGLEIVQPDTYYFGGMIRSMKVARMAQAFGKQCTPHMSGGGLGYLYMMHFVSALPNAMPHHEFKGLNTHVEFNCSTSPLSVVDGRIKVPTGPGSGVEIDPKFVKRHKTVTG